MFSNSVEEHIRHVDEVLTVLSDAGVSLKLKKCDFFTNRVDYLGHVIHPGKLEVASRNTDAIKGFQEPRTQTQLRSFLGLCNVYRRFVPNFARVAAPLNRLLQKGEDFDLPPFNQAQTDAFELLKSALIQPPVLRLPRKDLPYSVDTDACDDQVGCALLQTYPDGMRHPIGFWSRSLIPAEKNYSVGERECLAVVWAVQMLRPYFEHEHFELFTDHQALKWILTSSDSAGRLARWRLRLLEHDFTVEYKKGIKNQIADAISRLPTYGEADFAADLELPCFLLESTAPLPLHGDDPDGTPREEGGAGGDLDSLFGLGSLLRPPELLGRAGICQKVEWATGLSTPSSDAWDALEKEDLDVEDHLDACTETQDPVCSTQATRDLQPVSVDKILQEQAADPFCRGIKKRLLDPEAEAGRLYDEDERGLLVRIATIDRSIQIVLPNTLRQRVLLLSHYPRMAGHPGGSRMYQTLRRTFYWPSMGLDVYNTVRQCVSCAKERISLRKHSSLLKLFPATRPLEFVSIDILGPLPRSSGGHRYLLVITDRYTKFVRTVPLRAITALTVAKAFCEHWVFAYGPPVCLLSDNGGQFTSKFFQSICNVLGTRNLFTTAYHPQTNGQVERFNRTILAGLRHFCSEHGRDWDQFSSAVTYGYKNTVHRATGQTPFDLVLTRAPKPLALANAETIDHDALPPSKVKERLHLRLRKLMQSADRRLSAAQHAYKANYDKRVRPHRQTLKVGDSVFVQRETATEQEDREKRNRSGAVGDHKLRSKALGPFPVVKVASHTVTILRDGLADTVSKDRIEKAPSPRLTDPLLEAPPEAEPPALPPGRLDEAVRYPKGQALTPAPASFTEVMKQIPERPEPCCRDQGGPSRRPERRLRPPAKAISPRPARLVIGGDLPGLFPKKKIPLRKASPGPPSHGAAAARPGSGHSSVTVRTLDGQPRQYAFDRIVDFDPHRGYRVRWTNYSADSDTWEPPCHVPYNAVVRYHRWKKLPVPKYHPDHYAA